MSAALQRLSADELAQVEAYIRDLHVAHVTWIGLYIEWSSLDLEPEKALAVRSIAKLRAEIDRVRRAVEAYTESPTFPRSITKA